MIRTLTDKEIEEVVENCLNYITDLILEKYFEEAETQEEYIELTNPIFDTLIEGLK